METICKCDMCRINYSVEDLVRSLGDIWWKHKFCCAQCYTKYIVSLNTQEVKKLKEDLNSLDLNKGE